MSKIEISSIKEAEFLDLTTKQTPKKQKGGTVSNKACIILSVWGIILSILTSGIPFAVVSAFIIIGNKTWRNLKTSSAKWAISLTAVSLAVNLIMAVLLAL